MQSRNRVKQRCEEPCVSMTGSSSPGAPSSSAWQQLCKRSRGWLGAVLRAGPIPQHVAFIMDGNRRFAERLHLERFSGHQMGYQKLLDALEWCLDLGVQCVSVYAFSIENFRRSPEEVATLMALAEEKLQQLLTERELVDQYGIQIRVIGDLSLLPAHVRASAQHVMQATQHNSRGILNICFSYTSRQEMSQAVARAQASLQQGVIAPQDVTVSYLEDLLYTRGCPPVDLLIRTSGESRLSDFLLWQSGFAQLVFTDVLWPDFTFMQLLRAIVAFQSNAAHLAALRQRSKDCIAHHEREARLQLQGSQESASCTDCKH
ncbi:hypothetical protein WJX72_008740 [[Myrmecia] bisecta]|uniref:Alkyl transferase n=1 Tax=[Myrmecia] bisecta TaxID=41462 RepID=A0AAW1Q4H0_9CHLO